MRVKKSKRRFVPRVISVKAVNKEGVVMTNTVPVEPGVEPWIGSQKVSIMDIKDGQCRYIEGDDAMFCGQPTVCDSSWCQKHHGIVFLPPMQRFGRPKLNG